MTRRKTSSEPKQPPNVTDDQADDQAPETGGAADDGAHLANVIVPEIDDQEADEDAPISAAEAEARAEDDAPEPGEGLIDRDGFWQVFSTAFSVPGLVMPEMKPVAIQPGEVVPARAASDATYSLLEIYYPSALMPQSETLAHVLVAGPFFLGKVMVVREIIRARRAPPQPAPAPPPDDKPAEDHDGPTIDQEPIVVADPGARWTKGAA